MKETKLVLASPIMSYRIKIPEKVFPADEAHMLSWLDHMVDHAQHYQRFLLVGVGLVVLAGSIVGGVVYVDHQTSAKAQELEREAMHFLVAPSVSSPQQTEQALKDASARYRQIVEQYPRTPSAPLALYHLGNILAQTNESSAAIDAYQRYLMMYGSNPAMVGLVQQRLAYVYLSKGDREQAVKALAGILVTPGTLNRDQALFELARLEESQARPEGALAHYQELIKTYPTSPFVSEATIRTKGGDVKSSAASTSGASSVADPVLLTSPPAPSLGANEKKP